MNRDAPTLMKLKLIRSESTVATRNFADRYMKTQTKKPRTQFCRWVTRFRKILQTDFADGKFADGFCRPNFADGKILQMAFDGNTSPR